MRSSAVISTAVLATGTIAASAPKLPANVAVVPTPTADPNAARHVEKREIDIQCINSVSSQLGLPTGRSSDIQSWVAGPFTKQDPCTYTLSATLSSGLSTYLSDVKAWGSTVVSEASKITPDCGAAFSISFGHVCETSVTAVFTDDGDDAETASFPPVGAPTDPLIFGNGAGLPPTPPGNDDDEPPVSTTSTDSDEEGAAALTGRYSGMVASAVAAAAALGVVFAL